MRHCLALIVACVGCVSAGCCMPGERARVGWTLTVHKPALIAGDNSTLVSPSYQGVNAAPLGTVSGPVQQGQWNHGTVAPPIAVQGIQTGACGAASQAGQFASQASITCEDLCRLLRQVQAQPLPRVQQ